MPYDVIRQRRKWFDGLDDRSFWRLDNPRLREDGPHLDDPVMLVDIDLGTGADVEPISDRLRYDESSGTIDGGPHTIDCAIFLAIAPSVLPVIASGAPS